MEMTANNIMAVEVGGLKLKNPVMTASGTFGSGAEYEGFVDLSKLGAVVTKSVTPKATTGNPPPRIAETPSGMLNSIGLQNEGIEHFCSDILPALNGVDTKVVVSAAGKCAEDYAIVVERLDAEHRVDAIEVNVSCPNVKEGGMAFGVCRDSCAGLIKDLRRLTAKPMFVKLSPNVTDIVDIAKAVAGGGADALVVANTLLGMAVDIELRKPIMANVMGGMSGPAILPVALRLVWQVSRAVEVPVIGCGGISCAQDAIAHMLCGAVAVEVGTMNFIQPSVTMEIIEKMASWLADKGETAARICGTLQTN